MVPFWYLDVYNSFSILRCKITTLFWIVQIYFLFACNLLHPLHLFHKKKEQPLAIAPYCDSYVTAIFTAVLGSTFRHQRSILRPEGTVCYYLQVRAIFVP